MIDIVFSSPASIITMLISVSALQIVRFSHLLLSVGLKHLPSMLLAREWVAIVDFCLAFPSNSVEKELSWTLMSKGG